MCAVEFRRTPGRPCLDENSRDSLLAVMSCNSLLAVMSCNSLLTVMSYNMFSGQVHSLPWGFLFTIHRSDSNWSPLKREHTTERNPLNFICNMPVCIYYNIVWMCSIQTNVLPWSWWRLLFHTWHRCLWNWWFTTYRQVAYLSSIEKGHTSLN